MNCTLIASIHFELHILNAKKKRNGTDKVFLDNLVHVISCLKIYSENKERVMSLFLCFEFWIQVKRKDNAGWWEKGGNSVQLRILPDCSSRPLDYSHPVVQPSLAHCRKGKRTIVAGSMGLDRPNNVNTICLQGPLSEKTRKQGRFQPNIGLFFSSGYLERDGRRWSSSERAMSLWAGYSLHPVHEGGAGRGRGGEGLQERPALGRGPDRALGAASSSASCASLLWADCTAHKHTAQIGTEARTPSLYNPICSGRPALYRQEAEQWERQGSALFWTL